MGLIKLFFIAIICTACNWHPKTSNEGVDTLAINDTSLAKNQNLPPDSVTVSLKVDSIRNYDTISLIPSRTVDTKKVAPGALVNFAETLVGTPYKYASTNPKVGFDCSGFITYVFNHFGINVPRSSIDFTDVGKTINVVNAKRGDLVLFTGTDSTEKFIGHMGLVV